MKLGAPLDKIITNSTDETKPQNDQLILIYYVALIFCHPPLQILCKYWFDWSFQLSHRRKFWPALWKFSGFLLTHMALYKTSHTKTFRFHRKLTEIPTTNKVNSQALHSFTFSSSSDCTRCYQWRLISSVSVGSAGSNRLWRFVRLSDLSCSSSCASPPLSPDSWRLSRCHIAS